MAVFKVFALDENDDWPHLKALQLVLVRRIHNYLGALRQPFCIRSTLRSRLKSGLLVDLCAVDPAAPEKDRGGFERLACRPSAVDRHDVSGNV